MSQAKAQREGSSVTYTFKGLLHIQKKSLGYTEVKQASIQKNFKLNIYLDVIM